MEYFWAILLQIILIALNAVCASAEIAVISMNEAKINALAQKGGKNAKKAKRLKKLTADPARFLSTIQVAITLAGFLGSAFAAEMFAEPLVDAIAATGIAVPYSVISAVCVVAITLILAFFNIVFGELVPKRIAMNNTEKISTMLSGFLRFVSIIFKPVVFLLSASTNGILRLFGISPEEKGEEVTEEDIIMMAEASAENGNIESEENELIKNIFEFSDLTIGEICTHRTEADILFEGDTPEQWEEIIYSTEHSFYPVCGKNADDVKGVLRTKTYFRLKDRSRESVMANAVQSPVFIYKTAAANAVFATMKKTHDYFAVVVDEYGGMAGIVTIHDLLEAIVGDMDDKGEEAEYVIEKKENGTVEITGLAPFDEVEEALGVTLEVPEGVTYETFGGYVCGILVTLPEDGAQFDVETDLLSIKVLAVEKQCITKAVVTLKPDAIAKNEDEE